MFLHSAPAVLRYLSVLEGGYIVRRLSPWFVNAKKRLIKSPKVCIRDTGLVHRLLHIPDFDSLLGHPFVGESWEGYVIEQIYQQRPILLTCTSIVHRRVPSVILCW